MFHNLTVKRILTFTLVAILLAGIIDYLFYVYTSLEAFDGLTMLVWGILRMYTPMTAAYMVGGWTQIKNSLKFNKKILFLFLTAPFICFLAFLIYFLIIYSIGAFSYSYLDRLVSEDSFDTPSLFLLTLFNTYIAAISLNALYALGEEAGWRGFLQGEFESLGWGFIKASLMVGVIWGIWHASAIILLGYNYPENRLIGVFLFTLFTVSASIPHSYVRKISSSILPAASLHGAINALWGLTIVITDLPRELAGLGPIACISWALVSLILLLMHYIRGESK